MKFLTRSGIIILTVVFAVLIVYVSLVTIAAIALDTGECADMGMVRYSKVSASLGKLEIMGITYNVDILSIGETFQKYKNALAKADLLTPEILKFASFLNK